MKRNVYNLFQSKLTLAGLTLIVSASLMSQSVFSAKKDSPPEPVFDEDGISQPVFDSQVLKEDYYIVTPLDSDLNGENDIVYVQIFRSKDTELGAKMPVILAPSPYWDSDIQSDKGFENALYDGYVDSLYDGRPDFNNLSELSFSNNQRHQNKSPIWDNRSGSTINYLAARGFIMGYVQMLGTGQSTGCPMTSIENEGVALKAVVDWLNGRAVAYDKGGKRITHPNWTNGKVGAYGGSYNGYLVNALAATGVPELKFGITAVSVTDFYDYYRGNGAPRDSSANTESDIAFSERSDMITLYEYIVSKGLLSRECKHMREVIQAGQDRITGNKNDWWNAFDMLPLVPNVNTHLLVIAGLRDNNVRISQSTNLYHELRDQGKDVKMILHPAGHAYYLSTVALRVLLGSTYLYDQKTPYLYQPKVEIYRADGSVEAHADFPDLAAIDYVFHPQADGSLLTGGGQSQKSTGSKSKGGKSTDQVPAVIQEIVDDASLSTYDLLADASSEAGLLFKTPALISDTRLTGTPHIKIRLAIEQANPDPAATLAAANLSMAIADFAPDGSFKVITRGWINPQNRDSNYYKTPIAQGQFVDLAFDMEPNDHIFAAGHQMGLLIYSTDNLAQNMPPAGTVLKVDLSQTSMKVGIVGMMP